MPRCATTNGSKNTHSESDINRTEFTVTREQIRRRMAEIEKQTAALLDRIVEATSQTVIARYEQRITELDSGLRSWNASAL